MENSRKRQWLLIMLCWLMYTLAYVARYSFSANVTSVMAQYGESRTRVGTISSFFFFSYGVGQVINGIFCKYYNRRIVLPVALLGSFISNLILFIGVPFEWIKFVWLLNGVSQSFLWTSLILTLSQNLDDDLLSKASFIISSTAAVGMFVVYGLSSFLNLFGAYQYIFLTGACGMLFVALVWFFAFPHLASAPQKTQTVVENRDAERKRITPSVLWIVIMLAFGAVINNFVKDGLSGWMPDVLKSNYGFTDSISILMTLVLPLVGFVFQFINALVKEKIKNFIVLVGMWFAFALITLVVSVAFLNTDNWIMLVIMMALTVGFMSNVNNTITSMAPLYMRDSINSGLMAGLMDGFCYAGSTVGMVGLGAVSDSFGWSGAFSVLAVLCGLGALVMLVFLTVKAILKRKKKS